MRATKLAPALLLAVPLLAGAAGPAAGPAVPSPADQYQELFDRVQQSGLFGDSKTFADAIPRQSPRAIVAEYRAQALPTDAAMAAFVSAHFELPGDAPPVAPVRVAASTLPEHIRLLWPQLTRPPTTPVPESSELAFGFRHVVPGGRFREIYYWDSYFTMLGLMPDGYGDVARDMVDGFADLIARYGHVPNGTRSYYLSRSQPPFFYRMAGLLSPADEPAAYARYLPALRREYAWWMDGAAAVTAGTATGHVVRMPDGAILNRYWDGRDTPRDESYRNDLNLARSSDRPPAELYRDVRSAAESGWDFSSRWFADGQSLKTIETTSIVPVDLNSLLYGLERAIAQGCERQGLRDCAGEFESRARRRARAIDRYLWDDTLGCFQDYDWRRHRRTGRLSAAMVYPLFTGVASAGQAHAVAALVRAQLLAPGGLATTTRATGQQWDWPNGWAPLQWIAVSGLSAYGEPALAREIARRWLRTVARVYAIQGRLLEKYDLVSLSGGGGGEYPLQDGFGWTNGVTRALLARYPELAPSGGWSVEAAPTQQPLEGAMP